MKLLFLFVFLSVQFTFAQSIEEIGLAHSHKDYIYVNEIYNRLLEKVGDLRSQTPTLVVSDKLKAKMAIHLVEGSKHSILVEQTIVKVCQSMGEDGKIAMAFLLGHELTHFYREHENNPAFAASNGNLAKHKHNENEADTHGALLAYLAGYDILKKDERSQENIIAEFLELAYTAYNKADDLEGYQPLKQRKLVVEGIEEEVATLYQLHHFAVLAQVVGWDEQAGECYQYLTDTINIKTKDIIYNSLQADIQLADMLLAQNGSIYDGTKQLYLFPTMLEAQNPLLKHKSFLRGGALNYEPGQIDALLKRAVDKLEQLEKHNAAYVKQWAGSSLSAAHLLLLSYLNEKFEVTKDNGLSALMKRQLALDGNMGKLKMANTILEKIRDELTVEEDKDQLAMVALAQAIIYAHKNENQEAKISFEEAATLSENSSDFIKKLIQKNITIYRTANDRSMQAKSDYSNPRDAQIMDGVDVRQDVIERLTKQDQTSEAYLKFFDHYKSVLYSSRKKMEFACIYYPQSTLYLMKHHDGVSQSITEFFTIQLTKKLKTKEGIKIGATLSQLEKIYGKGKSKSNMTLARDGEQFISYPDYNLLFRLGQDGKVKEWAVVKYYRRSR
ncbi:MAG: hypothetical protein MK212_18900 [Saprospiraceae bacterium]|nr:hypothetical protein [Saprospiraceae bacterium]